MTAAAFTKLPNSVLLDATLTPGARLTYAILRHLAWQQGRRREEDAVPLPPLDEVAAAVGCSRTTVKTYVADLRRRGLIVTVRRGNQPTLYVVHDSPAATEEEVRCRTESVPRVGRNLTRTAGGTINGPKTTTEDKDPPTPHDLARPPRATLVEGRSLALDALLDVCGIDPSDANARAAQAAVYLNGRVVRGAREPGIRDAFWTECRRQAFQRVDGDDRLAALHDDPARFSRLLADRITAKAAAYRRAFPNATLSPKALRDWWFDIDAVPQTGRLSGDDLMRIANG